jgi:hypothetical protein
MLELSETLLSVITLDLCLPLQVREVELGVDMPSLLRLLDLIR